MRAVTGWVQVPRTRSFGAAERIAHRPTGGSHNFCRNDGFAGQIWRGTLSDRRRVGNRSDLSRRDGSAAVRLVSLLRHSAGRQVLERYFRGFLAEAEAQGRGFVLNTPTGRASAGWGERLGWTAEQIDDVNRDVVAFARTLLVGRSGPAVVNGVVGPHGDAYRPDTALTPDEAEACHHRQIAVLAGAGVDMIAAMTISTSGEAIGIAEAARRVGVPVVLSFTLETDGRRPGGMALDAAIGVTDAATGGYPAAIRRGMGSIAPIPTISPRF